MKNISSEHDEIQFTAILDRLKSVLGVTSDRQVALQMGHAADKLAYWKKRNTIPIKTLAEFARHRGLSLGWLLTGEETLPKPAPSRLLEHFDLTGEEFEEFFARIPIQVDAGDTQHQEGAAASKEQLFFPVHFLHLVLNDIYEKENLEAIYITHSNMEPTLRRGSLAIIDKERTALEDGKIFFFEFNGHLFLRRVFIDIITDTVHLKSDNDRHPPLTIPDRSKVKALRVIGKVIGYVGRMD